jgi:hypothetical protein
MLEGLRPREGTCPAPGHAGIEVLEVKPADLMAQPPESELPASRL